MAPASHILPIPVGNFDGVSRGSLAIHLVNKKTIDGKVSLPLQIADKKCVRRIKSVIINFVSLNSVVGYCAA